MATKHKSEARPLRGVIRILGKTVCNGVPGIKIVLFSLNGKECIPTKLTMTDKVRRRGEKLYAPNGVYQIVS